jgi:hypothetical protein
VNINPYPQPLSPQAEKGEKDGDVRAFMSLSAGGERFREGLIGEFDNVNFVYEYFLSYYEASG